jgi:TonB family protein
MDWKVATGPDSGRHWVYKGSPLFTYAGTASDSIWRKAPVMDGGVTQAPYPWLGHSSEPARPVLVTRQFPDYPARSLRAREEGDTRVLLCIEAGGQALYPVIEKSSGASALDSASLIWAWSARYVPARIGGKPVAVCGVRLELEWRLDRPPAPPPVIDHPPSPIP